MTTLATCDGPLVNAHDAVLLDLDGVVYRGEHAVPGAVEALNEVDAAHLAYLTNNANRPPEAVVDHLRSLGLTVDAGDVVTSAQAIAGVIARDLEPDAAVFVVGGAGLREALRARGLRPVDRRDAPDVAAVVQGYNPDLGWRDLAEAAYAIQSGLPWYVSNTDLTIPTADGIAPGNGSLVQAVQVATGAEPAIAGKPYAPLFEETRERLDARAPLMVGDRLDTDILGARRASIASLMVLTGVNSLSDVANAPHDQRPDFVAPDLAGLHATHLSVDVGPTAAHCGSAEVAVEGDRIVLVSGGADRLDAVRAAVALAWACRDASGHDLTVDATIGS